MTSDVLICPFAQITAKICFQDQSINHLYQDQWTWTGCLHLRIYRLSWQGSICLVFIVHSSSTHGTISRPSGNTSSDALCKISWKRMWRKMWMYYKLVIEGPPRIWFTCLAHKVSLEQERISCPCFYRPVALDRSSVILYLGQPVFYTSELDLWISEWRAPYSIKWSLILHNKSGIDQSNSRPPHSNVEERNGRNRVQKRRHAGFCWWECPSIFPRLWQSLQSQCKVSVWHMRIAGPVVLD